MYVVVRRPTSGLSATRPGLPWELTGHRRFPAGVSRETAHVGVVNDRPGLPWELMENGRFPAAAAVCVPMHGLFACGSRPRSYPSACCSLLREYRTDLARFLVLPFGVPFPNPLQTRQARRFKASEAAASGGGAAAARSGDGGSGGGDGGGTDDRSISPLPGERSSEEHEKGGWAKKKWRAVRVFRCHVCTLAQTRFDVLACACRLSVNVSFVGECMGYLRFDNGFGRRYRVVVARNCPGQRYMYLLPSLSYYPRCTSASAVGAADGLGGVASLLLPETLLTKFTCLLTSAVQK